MNYFKNKLFTDPLLRSDLPKDRYEKKWKY